MSKLYDYLTTALAATGNRAKIVTPRRGSPGKASRKEPRKRQRRARRITRKNR